MERIAATPTPAEEDDSIPKLWEVRTITKAGWKKHREHLLSRSSPGTRPEGWWLYEKKQTEAPPPWQQPTILYELGELSGDELRICLERFFVDYNDASRHLDRTAYFRWDQIPAVLVERWDAARQKGNPR